MTKINQMLSSIKTELAIAIVANIIYLIAIFNAPLDTGNWIWEYSEYLFIAIVVLIPGLMAALISTFIFVPTKKDREQFALSSMTIGIGVFLIAIWIIGRIAELR